MSRSDVLQIERVIGPRLERRNERRTIVVETQTPSGRVALRLSTSEAATLSGAPHDRAARRTRPNLPQFFLSNLAPTPDQPTTDLA